MLCSSQSSAAPQNFSYYHYQLIMIQYCFNVVFSPVTRFTSQRFNSTITKINLTGSAQDAQFTSSAPRNVWLGTPHLPRLPQTSFRLNANRLLPPNQGNCRFRSRRPKYHKPGCRLRHLGKVAEDMWNISAEIGRAHV